MLAALERFLSPLATVVEAHEVSLRGEWSTSTERSYAQANQLGTGDGRGGCQSPLFRASHAAEPFDTWRRSEGENLAEIARRAFVTLSQQRRPAP
jgi:hypothetical protein